MLLLRTLKSRADELIHREDTPAGIAYTLLMAALVVTVCTIFVVETFDISADLRQILVATEKTIAICFLIDYIMRWWLVNFSLKHLFTPMAIIDFLSILPLFLMGTNWQFVRVLRIFRILRLLRVFSKDGLINLHYTEFHLRVLRILFTTFSLIFISSGTIYTVEHNSSPELFPSFFDAFYFSVVTLTTVGYGDIVPTSTDGRFFTILIILSGVLLIPWQFMTLARFLLAHTNKLSILCPRCGYSIHDIDANYCKLCGKKLVEIQKEMVEG